MVDLRPGHRVKHTLAPRGVTGTIQSITEQSAMVLWDSEQHPLDHSLRRLRVTLDSPVPLDWTKPVYTQDGREWLFNEHGYGRSNASAGEGLGLVNRECWYGWVGGKTSKTSEGGGWWYEDGTPCPCSKHLPGLTNVAPYVVPLDANRPIVAVLASGSEFPFTIIGKIEDTTKIVGFWKDPNNKAKFSTMLTVDLTTRKIAQLHPLLDTPTGSALTFKNVPNIRVYGDTLATSGEGVNVTETDGKVTDVRLT